jgi:oxygen-independent coproporphyrinogen III oxidase
VPPRHLYIHVPFCARRCSYCDFAIAVRREVPVDEYLSGLETELRILRGGQPRAELDTIYLGGGTPSHLGPQGVARIMGIAREYFDFASDIEATIEANPDDVSPNAAAEWKNAGINRVSLGVQSFDDKVLEWMHRVHDSAQAESAVKVLREAGFDNISVDLIFALPESLDRSWERDLSKALALEPDHISLYGLTIEPATPLARWRDRGSVVPADEERYAEEFLLADQMAGAAGFEHYEVSNFGKPGKRSRHNSAYWTGDAYLGIGPSAHSYDGVARTWNVAPYADWVARLERGETVIGGSELLTDANRLAEKVYLGLRTTSGLPVSSPDRDATRLWGNEGWATLHGDVVRLTPEGWLRLDSLAAALTGL